MRHHALFLLSAILFACGGSESQNQTDYSNITLKMDTVIVDPGNEIINLKYGLWSSAVSEDRKHLYIWDNTASIIDKVNLDDLILSEKIKFEKEGPDGVGSYVSWITLLEDDKLVMSSFQNIGLFDFTGKKIRTFNITKEKFGEESLKDGESFNRKSILTDGGDVIYGMLGNWMSEKLTLGKINFKEKQLKRIELPGFEELPDYLVQLKTENMVSINSSDKILQKVGNRIILSNSAYTTLYLLDMNTDSVYQVNYTPQLTASAKKGGYSKEVDSEKRFKEVMADIFSEINFQPPLWDEKNRRFYRFSFETTPGEITDSPLFESPATRPLSKIFITIFDEDFNVLGESQLDQLTDSPSSPFVKDGEIWSYVNVEDELGLVRMAFE